MASAGASTPNGGAGTGVETSKWFGEGRASGVICATGVGREGIEPGFGTGTGVSFGDGRAIAAVPVTGGLVAFGPDP